MPSYLTPKPPRRLSIEGITIDIIIDAKQSGQLFGMIETIVPSGKGPLPHTHSREDETFYVAAGTAEFRLGDKKAICGPGSVVYGPRGVTHGYRNVGGDDLRICIVYTPGGVEESFQEWADLGNDMEQVKKVFAKYGVTPADK